MFQILKVSRKVLYLLVVILAVPGVLLTFINNMTGLLILSEWRGVIPELGIPKCNTYSLHPSGEKYSNLADFLAPDSGVILLNKGRIAWMKGDCALAKKSWEQAQQLKHDNVIIAFWLFWLNGADPDKIPTGMSGDDLARYAESVGSIAETSHTYDAATQWYVFSLKLKPTMDLAEHLATIYKRLGTQKQYNALWSQLVGSVPDDDDLYWWAMGKLAETKGDWKSAANFYNTGAEGTKDTFAVFRFRMQQAEPLKILGDWIGVEQAYLQAIQSQPDDTSPYIEVGNLYYTQENFDMALDWYQKADQLTPNNAFTVYHIAETLYQQGKCDEAIGYFQRVIRLAPKYSRAYYFLAQCFYAVGDRERALNYLNLAVAWSDQQPWQWAVQLGDWRLEIGDREGALSAYQKALEWRPNELNIENKIKLLEESEH